MANRWTAMGLAAALICGLAVVGPAPHPQDRECDVSPASTLARTARRKIDAFASRCDTRAFPTGPDPAIVLARAPVASVTRRALDLEIAAPADEPPAIVSVLHRARAPPRR